MAEFLTANDVSARLELLIGSAKQWLVFISPYLITSQSFKHLLLQRLEQGTVVWLVCGKSAMNVGEETYWKLYRGVHLAYLDNLHAKCYVSDHMALVTSLDLADLSQSGEHQMGISFSRESDKSLYDSLVKYAEGVLVHSEASTEAKQAWVKVLAAPLVARVTRKPASVKKAPAQAREVTPPPPPVSAPPTASVSAPPAPVAPPVSEPLPVVIPSARKDGGSKSASRQKAHCIRCNAVIKPDPEWPFCRDHKAKWLLTRSEEEGEKYCHGCGRLFRTVRLRPFCENCTVRHAAGEDVFVM